MASDQVTVAALGRPFRLGMLYDARTDRLVKGAALWDPAALHRMTQTRLQPYSNFKISASDSVEEQASLLEVQASLRASIACGLVEADGSAKYLHDKRQFQNQCRVTLQYKATTHFEQLLLTSGDWENDRSREMAENGLATHVVTGIEYGANAFFVFDSQILEASDVHEFKLKIRVVLHFIFWSIHFDYNKDLTDEQKSLVQKLTVKFYSDFLLESTPATFVEAVKTYTDMTKLLGENDKNAVPVKVWMVPLKYFYPKATQIVRDISVGLVIEAENALEDLHAVKMRCDDVLSVGAVAKFPQVRHQLHTFNRLCECYALELQRRMAEACPAIREGTKPESDLRSLFERRQATPFSQDKLTGWLRGKERVVNVVQFCLEIMKGVKVLSTQAEVDRFAMTPENSVCSGYIFTSLENPDPQLEEMKRCLDSLKTGKPYKEFVRESGQPWFYSKEIVTDMRDKAEAFAKTAGPVFIAAGHKDGQRGAAVVNFLFPADENSVNFTVNLFIHTNLFKKIIIIIILQNKSTAIAFEVFVFSYICVIVSKHRKNTLPDINIVFVLFFISLFYCLFFHCCNLSYLTGLFLRRWLRSLLPQVHDVSERPMAQFSTQGSCGYSRSL
uniref:Uncharacterized protein n=1 Tax=Neogobius melanostomus TaxID=47308 RepID=A0A8C6UDZ6_9GOBI